RARRRRGRSRGASRARGFFVPQIGWQRRVSEAMDRYETGAIEEKWQRLWADAKASEVSNDPIQPKSYVLEMLPYPSGTLHMGHMLVYTICAVVTRFPATDRLTLC